MNSMTNVLKSLIAFITITRREILNAQLLSREETESKQPSEQALLVEYEKAQDSAEHHDHLVWLVTSILWSANIVLLGFLYDSIANATESTRTGWLLIPSLLGLAMSGSVMSFVGDFREIKKRKYERCKAIEKKFGLSQHTSLEDMRFRQTVPFKLITWMFVVAFFLAMIALFF